MPELPEVDEAARRLRERVMGRTIMRITGLHPSQRRQLPAASRRQAEGQGIVAVERRGKHQLIRLANGASIHVHFLLDGDWSFTLLPDAPPRFARVEIVLDDGTRVSLTDPRALCIVKVYTAANPPTLKIGPDADDPGVTAGFFGARLARRRVAIKVALLDQKLLAGIGNIYAAEALWRARISPEAPADSLSAARVTRLLASVRDALADGVARAVRYRTSDRADQFHVYDREGKPCDRCGMILRRLIQGGRSTCYCPRCQRRCQRR